MRSCGVGWVFDGEYKLGSRIGVGCDGWAWAGWSGGRRGRYRGYPLIFNLWPEVHIYK